MVPEANVSPGRNQELGRFLSISAGANVAELVPEAELGWPGPKSLFQSLVYGQFRSGPTCAVSGLRPSWPGPKSVG
jgi:hypothetical protein